MGSIGWGPKRIQSEVSASHYNDGRAKSHVGFVNPVHFLHATTPDDQRLNHIVDQAGQLDKEKLSKEVQSPFFEVRDGKIVSHEGRHRMSALARQGYTSVPVTIHHGKGSNLDPADSVTLQPQFKGRDPVTVSNLVPLHHDYDDQINDMMKQQPEHFQDGGDVDGITAYHGSPHDFDEFDTSKIGTGEGAQAYGHGLYFAEAEPTAKGYRDALTDRASTFRVGNIDMPKWILRGIENAPDRDAAIEKHRQDFQNRLEEELKEQETSHQPWMSSGRISSHKDILRGLDELQRGSELPHTKGRMYEVHINAHPHHMLDWDKPLSEQSEHVQKALDSIQDHPDWTNGFKNELKRVRGTNYFDGNDLYRELIKAKSAPEIAQMLHGFGIKGIKYLDAGSRGDKAEPTHNYVVFDHNDVRVKRKYEQGGAVDGYEGGGEVDDHYIGEHYQDGGEVDPPKKKVKAYKLFRTDPKKPGKLFPLFVDANTPVPIKKWVEAKAGDPGKDPTKVKSKLGDLAYRPGWHAGDLPVATHIGGKSSSDLKAPDYRPDNHVWAEIEMPNDVDWQSEANSRVQYTKAGKPKPATAHITDQVPLGGHYRYKTNPNMTGNWLIGGSMKVNRILKDDEVKAINDANGVADLPRLPRAPETKARGGPIATSGPIVKRALELLSKDRTGR